ncbi:MAG: hypothetical protein PHD58_01040 [Anaerolineales bacterium]|nr:hypothetical protein [Anaerolineales bacterium]
MDAKTLKSITAQIYRKFPDMDGSKPTVRRQNGAQKAAAAHDPTYLLVFHKRVPIDSQRTISRYVRVVVNEQGKILKITTSR